MDNEELNKIGAEILDGAVTVHRELGPGLLESVYELALFPRIKIERFNRTTPSAG